VSVPVPVETAKTAGLQSQQKAFSQGTRPWCKKEVGLTKKKAQKSEVSLLLERTLLVQQ